MLRPVSCCSCELLHHTGGVLAGEAVPEEGAAAGGESPQRRPHRSHSADARCRGPRVPGQCNRRRGGPLQVSTTFIGCSALPPELCPVVGTLDAQQVVAYVSQESVVWPLQPV